MWLPACLLAMLAVFFAAVYGSGGSVASATADGWFDGRTNGTDVSFEETTSLSLTTFTWSMSLRSLISRIAVIGKPSFSFPIRNFFIATSSLVRRSLAL